MTYEVMFYFTDPSSGNGSGNLCDWGDDRENLVQKDSLVITDMAWGPGYKPAMNTCSMALTWDAVLVTRLMYTMDHPGLFTGPNITVKVAGQSDFLFTGYLRPTGDLTYSESGSIRIEAVDCTSKLEATYEGDYWGITEGSGFKVFDSDPNISLVHKLLEFAGWDRSIIIPVQEPRKVKVFTGGVWTESLVSTPGIEDKVRVFSLKRGDSIQEKLTEVLFNYSFVYHATKAGELEFLSFELPSTTTGAPEYSEEALPIIREFKVKKRDPKEKSYTVGYQKYKVSESNTEMLNKTIPSNYNSAERRLHNWNESDTRCWPPETDRDGNISNVHAFRTAKDAAGDSLGFEDVLEPWKDPGIRNVSNWFYSASYAILRFEIQYKVETSIFGIPTGTEERQDNLFFTINGAGVIDSSNSGDWRYNLPKAYVHSCHFDQNGLRLKLTRPSSHPWTENYSLLFKGVQVYGKITYMAHGKETSNDSVAPRVRSGEPDSLSKTYVSQMLIDPVRAQKLSDALYQGLVCNEITFKSLHRPILGSVIRVKHIGKGFDSLARVVKISSTLGKVEIFTVVAESISATTYADAMLQDPYIAPGNDSFTPYMGEEILNALDSDGRIAKPITGLSIPPGYVPDKSGLYFLKEHLGFYIQGLGWISRISEDGSANFKGKFTAGDGDHTIDFDPVTGLMKIRGELQVDGDSVMKGALRSENFSEGISGFQIKSTGDAEFNNLVVRGDIKASSNTTIQGRVVDGGLQSDNFVVSSQGWKLTPRGEIIGNSGASFKSIDFHNLKTKLTIGTITKCGNDNFSDLMNVGGVVYGVAYPSIVSVNTSDGSLTTIKTFSSDWFPYRIFNHKNKLIILTFHNIGAGNDSWRIEDIEGVVYWTDTSLKYAEWTQSGDYVYLIGKGPTSNDIFLYKIDVFNQIQVSKTFLISSNVNLSEPVIFNNNLYFCASPDTKKINMSTFEISTVISSFTFYEHSYADSEIIVLHDSSNQIMYSYNGINFTALTFSNMEALFYSVTKINNNWFFLGYTKTLIGTDITDTASFSVLTYPSGYENVIFATVYGNKLILAGQQGHGIASIDYVFKGHIKNETAPSGPNDLVNKAYIDSLLMPVGCTQIQYPGTRSPANLWSSFTWVDISAKAHTYGLSTVNSGNATSYATRANCQQSDLFTDTDYTIGTQISGGPNNGKYVREICTFAGNFARIAGGTAKAFEGGNQLDQIQNITGTHGSHNHYGGAEPATGAFTVGPGGTWSGGQAGGASNLISFDASRVVRAGTETRPINVTVKLWIRIA